MKILRLAVLLPALLLAGCGDPVEERAAAPVAAPAEVSVERLAGFVEMALDLSLIHI